MIASVSTMFSDVRVQHCTWLSRSESSHRFNFRWISPNITKFSALPGHVIWRPPCNYYDQIELRIGSPSQRLSCVLADSLMVLEDVWSSTAARVRPKLRLSPALRPSLKMPRLEPKGWVGIDSRQIWRDLERLGFGEIRIMHKNDAVSNKTRQWQCSEA